ncbi:YL1 nuclear protein-domain-containing protein [Abortiporus biennis]|nr:YL1 nuclear protein-domain-containing protein [Abortiporus biennis]
MEDSLVMRRSKRSTAGNRMEAALAEFKADELGQEQEEDVDFIMGKEEEDAFESDFASTDEEGAQEDVDAAAERMLQDEEKAKRKTARSHLEKVTAAAHARQKVTFNPQAESVELAKAPLKIKRRVSLGVVVDAETGQVVATPNRRQSRRTHTVMNTTATRDRARDEQEKKSTLPKKVKTKIRAPTQSELISRALDMEEDNIKEHRNYLVLEEEKRARARVERMSINGPLLRVVSRIEDERVRVELPPQPSVSTIQAPSPKIQTPASHVQIPPPPPIQYGYSYPGAPLPNTPKSASNRPTFFHPSARATSQNPYPPPPVTPTPFMYQYPPPSQPSTSNQPLAPATVPVVVQPPAPPPEPTYRTEKVSKSYVIHEIPPTGKDDDPKKPTWNSTMTAMFGDHVKWNELKVFSGKGRPMSRPVQTCPITGKNAKYLDPRTAVPFADISAYQTLTSLLQHEYIWSESLGCYTGFAGSTDNVTSSARWDSNSEKNGVIDPTLNR